MKANEFEKKMENMTSPDVTSDSTKQFLKVTLMGAQRSASLGFVLLAIPFLFIFVNIFKYQLGLDMGFLSTFISWIGSLDRFPGVNWLVRFILLGGPVLAVILNVLAITHLHHNRTMKEVVITLKLKWVNISILLICGGILAIFFLYLLVENVPQ